MLLLFQRHARFFRFLYLCGCLFLGLLFFTAGMGKMIPGFPGLMGPVWLEEKLAAYDLALYARFIAYSQIITGFLLLSRRFSTLGAVMLFPMLVNILMITISQNWRGTPYVVSVFLLMNLYLLAYDYHKLKFLISEDAEAVRSLPLVRRSYWLDGLWAVALVLLLMGAMLAKTESQIGLLLSGLGFALVAGAALWQLFRRKEIPQRISQ